MYLPTYSLYCHSLIKYQTKVRGNYREYAVDLVSVVIPATSQDIIVQAFLVTRNSPQMRCVNVSCFSLSDSAEKLNLFFIELPPM